MAATRVLPFGGVTAHRGLGTPGLRCPRLDGGQGVLGASPMISPRRRPAPLAWGGTARRAAYPDPSKSPPLCAPAPRSAVRRRPARPRRCSARTLREGSRHGGHEEHGVGTTSLQLVKPWPATASTSTPFRPRPLPTLRTREELSVKYGLCAYKWVICRAIAIRSIFFTKLNPTAAIRGFLGRVAKGFGDVDARVWGHVA